jgi:hypothetical protein
LVVFLHGFRLSLHLSARSKTPHIRNADLRALLFPPIKTDTANAELRRRSAAITRQFALLRAHGLLRKLPRIHCYQITPKGRRIITALLAACHADVEQLTKIAA